MSNELRSAVIKLAYANPSLRGELLPLLTKEAEATYDKYVERKERERDKGKKVKILDRKEWESYQDKGKSMGLEREKGQRPGEEQGDDEKYKQWVGDEPTAKRVPAQVKQDYEDDKAKKQKQQAERKERKQERAKQLEKKPKEEPKKEEPKKEEPKKEEPKKKPSLLDRAKSFFTGKKASDQELRSAVIKLAYANPSLRGELLPLLTKQAMEFPSEGALKKYLENHPGADRRNHSVAKPSEGGGEAPKADKNKGKGLRERKVPTPKFKGSEEQVKQAKAIVEKYGLTDEELDDFADWKRAKPEPGDRTLDFATLKREWIESIKDPKKKEQARKRLAQMTPAEFKIMYLAVVADEEGEMGKMASSPSLRAAVIKLAHTNPSLRGHLLPLLIED